MLTDGSGEGLIYACQGFDALPETSGVYIFARRHGDAIFPLYIGKATNLRQRLQQQFQFVRLMKGIEQMPTASRLLLVGELQLKRGLRTASALKVLESALIAHAMTQGHELLNKQGTRTPVHNITNFGNWTSRVVAPLRMKQRL